jgi:hypothetical protein
VCAMAPVADISGMWRRQKSWLAWDSLFIPRSSCSVRVTTVSGVFQCQG